MATKLVTSRNIVRMAARALDEDWSEKVALCSMAKYFATEECSKVSPDFRKLYGSFSYLHVHVLVFFGIMVCVHMYNYIIRGINVHIG